uniref:C2H2-type domain-containing protein n=1 Tax=Anabas testudineus TaxID=64144 RepID=A0A3Q1HBL1_ANATE
MYLRNFLHSLRSVTYVRLHSSSVRLSVQLFTSIPFKCTLSIHLSECVTVLYYTHLCAYKSLALTQIFIPYKHEHSVSTNLPRPTQEVCAQEQQIQKECIFREAKEEPVTLPFKEERTELWTRSVETLAYSNITDTKIVTVGEHKESQMPESLTQVTVGERSESEAPQSQTQVGEHMEYEIPPQHDQLLPSFGASLYTKKKTMFFCNICCQAFVEKAELKLHLAAHATNSLPKPTNKEFTCFVCGRITDTRSQMICHMRTHTGEKPFSCPVCGNRYKLKSHMKEHMRTHTGERPYSCYICGRSFNRSSTMSKHARIQHREGMPFKCVQCSQRFSLLTHESKSHDGKGNFDCHVCGKHIPCQSNLQNHMRVHTGERPYSCHFCGKCFKLKGHMTEHIRTHTGEKPFSCHICDKSFNRGSTLRKHVLAKHKEERPYKCRDCEELFTERLLMKRHMRKIHGIKLSTNHSAILSLFTCSVFLTSGSAGNNYKHLLTYNFEKLLHILTSLHIRCKYCTFILLHLFDNCSNNILSFTQNVK